MTIIPDYTGSFYDGTTYTWQFDVNGFSTFGSVSMPIQVYVNWGDNSNTGWVTYQYDGNGISFSLAHSYSSTGFFTITASFRYILNPLDQPIAYAAQSSPGEDIIAVGSPSSGGSSGGGGCVAQNTPILMANGKYKMVQSLEIGDQLEEFDYQSHQTSPLALTNLTVTKVSELININNGLISLTLSDQPIFISNSTYVGWVQNPENLKVGDEMFNPVLNKWNPITSLSIENGNFKVYGVSTAPYNNFIANGVLLDQKA